MIPENVVDRANPMDHATALRRAEGDVELLADMARIFLENCPRMLANIRAAVAKGAPTEIGNAAHELKGCLANFAAYPAFAAAETLEMLGRAGELTDAPAAAARLESEIERLTPAMNGLLSH